MSMPIIEKITRHIFDTINGVRVSSGYHYDLIALRRSQHGISPTDNLVVIEQDNPTVETSLSPQGWTTWRQPYNLHCFIVESESSSVPIDYRINIIRSDVSKSLMVDSTRGGLAIDTRITDPIIFDDPEGKNAGITVRADVIYRTLEDDPYKPE